MSTTRKISVFVLAVIFAITLGISFAFSPLSGVFAAEEDDSSSLAKFDFYLDANDLTLGDITSAKEFGDPAKGTFIVMGGPENAVTVDGNVKTLADIYAEGSDNKYTVSKRIKYNGSTNQGSLERSILFYLDKQAKISVYALASSSSATYPLTLWKNGGSKVGEQYVDGSSSPLEPYVYETTEAGSYYFACLDGNCNIYLIGVEYTGEAAPVQRNAWSDVAAPTITGVNVIKDGDELTGQVRVSFSGVVGPSGADKIQVSMYEESDTEFANPVATLTSLLYANASSVVFTPPKSGKYVFKAVAERSGETEKKASAPSEALEFQLPLAKPTLRARTGENGVMVVTVNEVVEADKYLLSYKKVGTDTWTTEDLTPTGEGTILFSIEGLQVNDEVEIKVEATRTATSETTVSDVIKAKLRNAEERDWAFTYFGQSTKSDLNRMTALDGTRNGGNIYDGFILRSASFDTTGNVISKGGKFTYGGMDGISYYYTPIDAETEDFRLRATVTATDLNPIPDGQEGFALLIRDSIGDDASTAYYYTNSAAAIATKIQYKQGASNNTITDGLGSRFVTGIKDTNATPEAGTFKNTMKPFLQDKVQANTQSYTIEVEKVNNVYYVRYFNGVVDPTTGKDYIEYALYYIDNGDGTYTDQLRVIDKDHVYVGFAVARGCNAKFENIEFEVTEKSNEVIEILPDRVTLDARIVSPTTTSVSSYQFNFTTSASGYLNAWIENMFGDYEKTQIVNAHYLEVPKKADGTYYDSVEYSVTVELPERNADYYITATFDPDDDFIPGDNMVLDNVEQMEPDPVTVTFNSFRDASKPLYVSPENPTLVENKNPIGSPTGDGTINKPLDIQTAINYCLPGQTILLLGGTYTYGGVITVERGNDGTADAYKVIRPDSSCKSRPLFDFGGNDGGGSGFTLWGNYWHIYGIEVCNTAYGKKSIQIGGNNIIVENVVSHHNGDTGFSVSGKSTEPREKWPTNNKIINCTSYMNKDKAQEDADGFAAKLYCGEGNEFIGCIAYCNADDGWDLYSKTENGPIGQVKIKDCVTFGNGFNIDGSATLGNGNGFKLGGESLTGKHVLENCVSFGNKAKGVDSNSCPDDMVYNVTSVYNIQNFAFYSNKADDFTVEKVISFVAASSDKIPNQVKSRNLYTADNYYYNTKNGEGTVNSSGQALTPSGVFTAWSDDPMTQFGFVLDAKTKKITQGNFNAIIDKITKRNADDSINMNGFLVLKDGVTSGGTIHPTAATEWPDVYEKLAATSSKGCKKGCKSALVGESAIGFTVVAIALGAIVLTMLLKKKKA